VTEHLPTRHLVTIYATYRHSTAPNVTPGIVNNTLHINDLGYIRHLAHKLYSY